MLQINHSHPGKLIAHEFNICHKVTHFNLEQGQTWQAHQLIAPVFACSTDMRVAPPLPMLSLVSWVSCKSPD